ncbi:MAG: FAD-dependent oxidoreductase, partial [Cypionkella sp.]|nr:FAD-dependent oxidoreductase [Cypionkella sp.]
MKTQYDVVIVGGAVIGSAVAYFLMANPDFDGSVLVVERDPTYAKASTSLSAASIRTQFSNAINVKISQFGYQFIKDFPETMQVGDDKPDLMEMRLDTLKQNALNAGYKEDEIEVKWVTDEEWAAIQADL